MISVVYSVVPRITTLRTALILLREMLEGQHWASASVWAREARHGGSPRSPAWCRRSSSCRVEIGGSKCDGSCGHTYRCP